MKQHTKHPYFFWVGLVLWIIVAGLLAYILVEENVSHWREVTYESPLESGNIEHAIKTNQYK